MQEVSGSIPLTSTINLTVGNMGCGGLVAEVAKAKR
jgi:hypothetical protein